MTRPELVSVTKDIEESLQNNIHALQGCGCGCANCKLVIHEIAKSIAGKIADRVMPVDKTCKTCVHGDESMHEAPCDSCVRMASDNWQPKEPRNDCTIDCVKEDSEKCDCDNGKILITDENYENEREIVCRKCGGSGEYWNRSDRYKCDCNKNKENV
jgi:hypothetical protein